MATKGVFITNESLYLVPPTNSFWKWSEMQEAVVWTDGRTIAFREELAAVLERLAPHGLPRFGSILLLIAATRDSWKVTAYEPGILAGLLDISSDQNRKLLSDVLAGLDRVADFDSDLAKTPAAKCLLAEVVFDHPSKALSPADARKAIALLHGSFQDQHDDSLFVKHGSEPAAQSLRADLWVLHLGLKNLDNDRLRTRRDTGLEELPQPTDLELPLPEQVRSLLKELEDDDQLAGLARAARQLMAAVTLPRATSDPDELEMGGISDVTNRGPLDRLLLSELAHDDLTLAVRVATNEAMYLRREAPPRTPQRTRVLLLESGVRSWGTPRLFGCAVALAMAGTLDQHTDLHAFRAKGERVVPTQLHRADGLRMHLAALEADAHPGAAMRSFREEMQTLGDGELEPVLIVTEDTAADPDFQRALADAKLTSYYLATVDRIGRFQLLQHSVRGTKAIRTARLDLESLFRQRHSTRSVVDGELDQRLPAIFAMKRFPLRLPHPIDPKRLWPVGERGVLAITRDRRLMWWETKGRGAIQLQDPLDSTDLKWSRLPDEYGVAHGVLGQQGKAHIIAVDLSARKVNQFEISSSSAEKFSFYASHGDVLFQINDRNNILAYSLSTGERMADVRMPKNLSWVRDRFFRGMPPSRWWALTNDGNQPRVELVVDHTQVNQCPPLQTMFDRQGTEGPIGISTNRKLYFTGTEQVLSLTDCPDTSNLSYIIVSPDGSEVILPEAGNQGAEAHLIDVRTATVLPLNRMQLFRWAEQYQRNYIESRSLRHRFLRIARDESDRLILTTRKGQHLALSVSEINGETKLALQSRPMSTLRDSRTFKQLTHPRVTGYKLTAAEWNDGSRAYLDTRGLLHLKSSRDDLPEISIVLCDGPLSGWCSDGRMFGEPYYLGDHEASDATHVYREIMEPFCRSLS